jgi:hypothetical protein
MPDHEKAISLAARKQRLIAEGQLYRVSIEHAKVNAAYGMRPENLLHGLVNEVVGLTGGGFGGLVGGLLSPGGINLRSALPLLLTAGSFIARRRLIKPVLGLGLVAAAVMWYRRR